MSFPKIVAHRTRRISADYEPIILEAPIEKIRDLLGKFAQHLKKHPKDIKELTHFRNQLGQKINHLPSYQKASIFRVFYRHVPPQDKETDFLRSIGIDEKDIEIAFQGFH